MTSFKLLLAIVIVAAFVSCSSGGGKKVTIISSGKITFDPNDQKNIKLDGGTSHNEKDIILTGDKETLTIQTPGGNKTYEVNEPGCYLLNLKPDTLIGGIVNYGEGNKSAGLTGEDVDHIIDSTQKLILGQNASDDKKTYFIPPFTIKKVSTNSEAKIVGPYNGIPGTVDAGSGKTPEIYKMFTTKDKRQSLETLIKERKK